MPERVDHQASGLSSLLRQHGARLAAMVNHGNEGYELPLLWRLCLTWVELGYSVTVLDAGTHESAENPGLDQLLDFPSTALAPHQDGTVWNVIPSAIGLQALLSSQKRQIPIEQQLGGLFADDGIVVVYGNASMLTQLLADQTLQPLLVVSTARASLLTSYQALKRLLRVPGLTPLVIDESMVPSSDTARRPSAAETLADCARNFLSLELPLVHLQIPGGGADNTTQHQRLALRVLENALPLCARGMHHIPTGTKMEARKISRSH